MARPTARPSLRKRGWRQRLTELPLHLMLIPGLVVVLIYNYAPMFGLVMAFQDYKPTRGITGSTWVGLENFRRFFTYPGAGQIIFNTLFIAIFKLILGLVVPVLFALLLNEVRNRHFNNALQTITYLPNFLSWVILGGIFVNILSPSNGAVNELIKLFGGQPVYFLGDNSVFPWTLIVTDVWKNFGYSSIVYLAALTAIDPALYEAAAVDGASRLRQVFTVTLPGILPIVFVMAVLSLGNVLNAGFDQVFNLYSPQVYASGDILDTFIYRMGLESAQYGLSTAISFMKSVISLILISIAYFLADRFGDYRVF